ncbi:mid region of cactin-domain-containing protein [Gaertneriomyces semiglobifer]|nr:mid region of cactin-domain-containing protein [Gaertneriomyces semiglobifer]
MPRRKDSRSPTPERHYRSRRRSRDDTPRRDNDDRDVTYKRDSRSERRERTRSRSTDRKRSYHSTRRDGRSRTPDRTPRKRDDDDARPNTRSYSYTSSDSEDDSKDHRKRASSSSRNKSKKSRKEKRKRSTSSERRTRKAARKAEKKQLKEDLVAHKESQLAAHLNIGYANSENPFGDSNLAGKFVWLKKRAQDAKQGISHSERLSRDTSRREEIKEELDKLKRRREEREREMQLREEEQLRLQRELDRAAMGDWEAKENEFHLQQAKTRAQIRIKEGRAKPIDILAMNLSLASDLKIAEEFDAMGLEMGIEEPYMIFNDLRLEEIEELHKDIRLYLSLETDEENIRFWQAMIVVCEDELTKHRGHDHTGGAVSAQVAEDVERMFMNKTYDQLSLLQKQIEQRLAGGHGPVDVEYWETVIRALVVWKAKTKLRDMHAFLLTKRLERLKSKKEDEKDGSGGLKQPIRLQRDRRTKSKQPMPVNSTPDVEEEVEEVLPYDPSLSPKLLPSLPRELPPNYTIVDASDDLQQLAEMRDAVQKSFGQTQLMNAVVAPSTETLAERQFIQEMSENMGIDEEAFGEEADISMSHEPYMWQDKYRPRKPRYFNRVHTGYEWNKYNQTHYDSDNPPPKVVQGYKFNIFYPDLIDKTKAPTYTKERDPLSNETVILRFSAGPPYEDIAFRIVDREWEYSHKKGFRSAFDRGVLQLWFHFRREYYRR